jgi:hypothetical protein
MTHERGELVEPALWVKALPIPSQQASHRERVTQGVQSGRGDAVWDRESQLGGETVERLACAARVHAVLAVETEQRVVTRATAPLDLAGEEFADARPVGDQAALAELAAPARSPRP